MHITLIRPPTVTHPNGVGEDALPPLGVAYLCSMLRSNGFEAEVIDAVGDGLEYWREVSEWPEVIAHGLSIRQVIDRIPPATDLIGVSCMFSATWPYNRLLIDEIRRTFTKVPIVIGGEHVTAVPGYIMERHASVDYCVLGEGEAALTQLATLLDQAKPQDEIIKNVPGLVGRVNGRVRFWTSVNSTRRCRQYPGT